MTADLPRTRHGRGKDWFRECGRTTQVTTLEPLMRSAGQQSNCFVITAIGNTFSERSLGDQRTAAKLGRVPRGLESAAGPTNHLINPQLIINTNTPDDDARPRTK